MIVLLILSMLVLLPLKTEPAAAYLSSASDDSNAPPRLEARRTNGSITVDGHLDEADWASADAATDFTQFSPDEGTTPTFKTEVRVLYGEQSVFIGAKLYDDAPQKVTRTLSRRDELNKADRFRVYIDSYLNHQAAYSFAVSAGNVQADWIMRDRKLMDGLKRVDTSWDAIWYSDVQITSEGWTVEMEIPYTMLRFDKGESIRWGINFQREIARLGEVNDWVFIPRSANEFVANFGMLHGLSDIEPRRNLQVTPFSLSRVTAEPAVGGDRSRSRGFEIGTDVKVGLSSSMTLDATLNPDFGQVESDPAILNLTTYETFFPEKRPFFLEGVDIFDFSFPDDDGSLLYTRRIGGSASPILGALKLSGRTPGGYSLGVLGATTGAQHEPGRYYGAGRVRRDFGRTSYLGGMITGYRRDPSTGLGRQTFAGGTDWDLRFLEESYQFKGFGAFSHRSTNHRAPVSGLGFYGEVGNVAGHFTYSGSIRGYDGKFQANDVGWLRENDFLRAEFTWQDLLNANQPFGPFRRANIGGSGWKTWQYATGINRGFGSFTYTNWRLNNFHLLGLNIRLEQIGGYDVRETRGLGPYKNPGHYGFDLEYDSDPRQPYELSHRTDFLFHGNGGNTITSKIEAAWDLTARINISTQLEHERDHHTEAWMSNESFARRGGQWLVGPSNTPPSDLQASDFRSFQGSEALDDILRPLSPTSGNRYYVPVFGRRDTRSLSLQLRSNIVFLPRLSLQVFNQLFAARGQYQSAGILTAPDQITTFPAYPKRHDFAIRSFISNIVLRWEYRPGSTLYVVWSQSRRRDEDNPLIDPVSSSPYETPTYQQLVDTFDLFPTDVFLIKLNYTFLR